MIYLLSNRFGFLFLFHLFHLFCSCVTFNLVLRPVFNLALLWTVPYWFTFWTSFKCLFSTFSTFESLHEPFNTVIWVQFSKILNMLFLSLVHWLFKPLFLLLGKLFPIYSSTYVTQNNRNLLNNKWIAG